MPKLKFQTDLNAIAKANMGHDGATNDEVNHYSKTNAYILAAISSQVYDSKDNIENASTEWGFEKAIFIEREEKRAVIFYNQENIVIAFRGTNNLSNWGTDIQAAGENAFTTYEEFEPILDNPNQNMPIRHDLPTQRLAAKRILVHKGFFYATKLLWNDDASASDMDKRSGISSHLSEIVATKIPVGQKYNIWLTGHSLGGAMAILARAMLARINEGLIRRHNIPGRRVEATICTYTIGAPRCGNIEFANLYDGSYRQNTFRIVNHNDPIPTMPSRYSFVRYKHVGESYTYYDNQVVRNIRRGDAYFRRFKNVFYSLLSYTQFCAFILKPFVRAIGVDDHRSAEYLDTLSKALRREGCDPNLFILSNSNVGNDITTTNNSVKELEQKLDICIQQQEAQSRVLLQLYTLYTALKKKDPNYAAEKIQRTFRRHVAKKQKDFESLGLLLHSQQYVAAVGQSVAVTKQARWKQLDTNKKKVAQFTRKEIQTCLQEELEKVTNLSRCSVLK